MNIFISWSGNRSHQIAELFNGWIRCVIQAAKPWISSHDIDRGALWFSEISKTLATSRFGIICLTPENKTEPWILFEAGALAKGIEENRVCTLLIDLKDTDVGNPLAQFNHTIASNKESMWELVQTINKTISEKQLEDEVLKDVFETYWERFIKKYDEIIKNSRPEEHIKKRTNEEILNEILTTVRAIDKRSQINDMLNSSSKYIMQYENLESSLNPTTIKKIHDYINMINKDNPENLIIQSQEFSESELDKKEESSSKNIYYNFKRKPKK